MPIWWQKHLTDGSQSTVVYLDAHLDLQLISEDKIDHLKNAKNHEEICALETPNHLNPSSKYCFGIENFLYAAKQLNLIKRLIWVAPPHIPRTYEAALIDYMQQMDGIQFDELCSFRELECGALRGQLMGLDITICDYTQVGALNIDRDYVLDIDIDYFVHVPSDRLWIDPKKVLGSIAGQLGQPEIATVSRAVSSGFTPLSFRFLGDYLYSLMEGNQELSDYYQNLYQAYQLAASNDIESAAKQIDVLIQAHPNLAAAHYIKGLISQSVDDKKSSLATAAGLDAAYQFNFSRDCIGLLHRKKPLSTETLQSLARALQDNNIGACSQADAEIALAHVLAVSGNTEQAERLLARQKGDYQNHPDIRLSIAESCLSSGIGLQTNKAALNSVLQNDKNATMAHIYLGDIAQQQQNWREARFHYLSAHKRAPAWSTPLEKNPTDIFSRRTFK